MAEAPELPFMKIVALMLTEPDPPLTLRGVIRTDPGRDDCWQFDREHDSPLASPVSAMRYGFSGTGLLERKRMENFVGTDFTTPTGAVTATSFLGRPAWQVELAPPSHKPYPLQWIVGAETGLLLQQRNDGFVTVEEWTELVVGEPLDPALFEWDGPSRSEADVRVARDAAHERDMAGRAEWFAANVATEALRVELTLEPHLHEWEEDGSFQASRGQVGVLARRPRSDTVWKRGWPDDAHRWSTERWDWAVQFHQNSPTEAGLIAFERQFHD
jgi:hypothetical protein